MNTQQDYNFPPDDGSEFYAHMKGLIESIRASAKVARGRIWDNFGIQIWEESEEDYQIRMNE